ADMQRRSGRTHAAMATNSHGIFDLAQGQG
ncbi:MAG: hypothetical protein RIR14_1328, partial [Pseudomonadota bacterium]